MQLAAKHLLKLGVKPEVVVELEKQAEEAGTTLRYYVQTILGSWAGDHAPTSRRGWGDPGDEHHDDTL